MNIYSELIEYLTVTVSPTEIDGKTVKRPFMPGKPKIMIIQACRGANFIPAAHPIDNECRRQEKESQLPNDVDTLVINSTLSGCFANRSARDGSPYIFFLCQVLENNYHNKDIISQLTIVNKLMATKVQMKIEITTIGKGKTEKNIKLMSTFRSHLTKKLFLSPPQGNPHDEAMLNYRSFCDDDDYLIKTFSLRQGESINNLLIYNGTNEKNEKLCIFINQTTMLANQEEMNKMKDLFEGPLKFTVLLKENLNSKKIKKIVSQSAANLKAVKLLVVIMFTNGYGDTLYDSEGNRFSLRDVVTPFKNNDLLGCPKVFIFQARGGTQQDMCEHYAGENYKSSRIISFTQSDNLPPQDADVIIMYSGCLYQPNEFIDDLYDALCFHYEHYDVTSIFTFVVDRMSQRGKNTMSGGTMPCWFSSTLTGLLYFSDSPTPVLNNFSNILFAPENVNDDQPCCCPIADFVNEEPEIIDNHKFIEKDCVTDHGLCIILNQTFLQQQCNKINDDIDRVAIIFKKFHFKIIVLQNQNSTSIQNILFEVAGHSNRKKTTSVVVISMSHGFNCDQIWAADQPFLCQEIVTIFSSEKCPILRNIPKCFIFQSCNGELSRSNQIGETFVIEHDMLVVLARTHDNYCTPYESVAGSIFIREICREMENKYLKTHKMSKNWTVQNVLKVMQRIKSDLLETCEITVENHLNETLRWSYGHSGYIS